MGSGRPIPCFEGDGRLASGEAARSRDLCRELHERYVRGDAEVREALAACLVVQVPAIVRRRFPRVDRDIIWDACVDAILAYLARPGRYVLRPGVLPGTVVGVWAGRRVLSRLRTIRRSGRHVEVPLDDSVADTLTVDAQLGPDEPPRPPAAELLAAIRDPRDRHLLACRLAGERRSAVLAEVLGVGHLEAVDRRREVKRAEDRIRRALQRWRRRNG